MIELGKIAKISKNGIPLCRECMKETQVPTHMINNKTGEDYYICPSCKFIKYGGNKMSDAQIEKKIETASTPGLTYEQYMVMGSKEKWNAIATINDVSVLTKIIKTEVPKCRKAKAERRLKKVSKKL